MALISSGDGTTSNNSSTPPSQPAFSTSLDPAPQGRTPLYTHHRPPHISASHWAPQTWRTLLQCTYQGFALIAECSNRGIFALAFCDEMCSIQNPEYYPALCIDLGAL